MTAQTIENFTTDFETRTRSESGTTYICTADHAPEWVSDLVHELHDDLMPDDWRYRIIQSCADALSEDPELEAYEWAGTMVDCYYHNLMSWLASGSGRVELADETAEEIDPTVGIYTRAALGQEAEYRQVMEALQAHFKELENEE